MDIFYPEPYSQIHKEYISKYDNALLSELTSCYGQPGYNLGNVSEQSWETLTLKKIIYIMSQIAQGLRCLHINKIIHLDMKPENVLFLKSFMIKSSTLVKPITHKSRTVTQLQLTVTPTDVHKLPRNFRPFQVSVMCSRLEWYFMNWFTERTWFKRIHRDFWENTEHWVSENGSYLMRNKWKTMDKNLCSPCSTIWSSSLYLLTLRPDHQWLGFLFCLKSFWKFSLERLAFSLKYFFWNEILRKL